MAYLLSQKNFTKTLDKSNLFGYTLVIQLNKFDNKNPSSLKYSFLEGLFVGM
jgi:hypothetical protein